MTTFQRVGLEWAHSILKWPYLKSCTRADYCTEVSSYRGLDYWGSSVYRGGLVSEGWTRGSLLYTEVASFQRVGLEWAPLYTEVAL